MYVKSFPREGKWYERQNGEEERLVCLMTSETEEVIDSSRPVSYTHLDVYKRQGKKPTWNTIQGIHYLAVSQIRSFNL